MAPPKLPMPVLLPVSPKLPMPVLLPKLPMPVLLLGWLAVRPRALPAGAMCESEGPQKQRNAAG